MILKLRSKLFIAFFWVITLCTVGSFLYSRSLLLEHYPEEAISLLKRGAVLGFLLALAFAAAISHFVARVGSATARSLASTASRMAAGDLNARARVSGRDELSKLGASLDQLAESLSTTLRQLRAERDRLDAVLSGMAEGVLLLDRRGRIELVNPALSSMSLLGSEVQGKAPIEVIRNAELSMLLESAREAGEPVSGELELNVPTTSRLLVRTRPLAGKEGGLVAVFVDVTDLRRLEGLRRDFVANASHELRTPIASIHSAAETLVAGAGSEEGSRTRFLDIIMRNATRLHQLVDDMLDLSRIESRGFNMVFEPVMLVAVAEQVVVSVAADAGRKQIEVVVDLPDDAIVYADAHATEQILLNLVDNAIKYCPEKSKVVVRRVQGDGWVDVLVSDNGRGIESKHLPRLFERFYRVDAGRSRDVGGTGLGLAIVKHLSEAMKGSVRVESEVGRGTTFTVRLPAHQ